MRILFVSLAVIVTDQLSKLAVKGFSVPFLKINYDGMYEGQRIHVLGNFFRITFIENPGMAFGFDPGINFKLWISVFSILASVGLIVYIYKVRNQNFTLKLSLAFILGGAIGNLIDRMFYGVFYNYAPVFYGYVVDFLDFDFFHFSIFGKTFDRWPIFNFADAAVTIGLIILLFFYKQNQKEEQELDGQEISVSDELIKENMVEEDSGELAKGIEDGQTNKGKEIPL